jgi:carotenoid cleavage oxygenase
VPLEFPRVDERVVGRRHRWGWASEVRRGDGANGFGGRLVRIDGATGEAQPIDLGAGRLSGEWVMVPREGDAAEDDGWLLSLVYDAARDRSELVVLSAGEPETGPVATVKLPGRVPMGFHGNWVPAS